MKGLSVAAVNERLRAARRKTGIGSSRELARELRLQENRNEEIGVFESPEPMSQPNLLNTRLVGRRMIMPFLMIAAMASVALMMQQPPLTTAVEPTTAISNDPLLKNMAEQQTLPEMHDRVRGEGRDVTWAPHTETALLMRYAKIPGLRANAIRVICGRSLCEIASSLPNLTKVQNAKLVEDLQAKPLNNDVRAMGLRSVAIGFGESFVAYWRRIDG